MKNTGGGIITDKVDLKTISFIRNRDTHYDKTVKSSRRH